MKVKFSKRPNFRRIGQQKKKAATAAIEGLIVASVRIMTDSVLTRTPVYTGTTLVNFQWAVGGPVQVPRPPIARPSLPGITSTLAVGTEPRRAANAAIVLGESEALISKIRKNPFQTISISNPSDSYYMVEYGTYSPDGSRTPPGGITRAAEAQIDLLLGPK